MMTPEGLPKRSLPRREVAVTLDGPLTVVALHELDDGVAQLLEVVVEIDPRALFFERTNEPLRASLQGGSPAMRASPRSQPPD